MDVEGATPEARGTAGEAELRRGHRGETEEVPDPGAEDEEVRSQARLRQGRLQEAEREEQQLWEEPAEFGPRSEAPAPAVRAASIGP